MLFYPPQPSHLSFMIPRKLLIIFNCFSPSFESRFIKSLSVTIAAALYTKNVTNGGRKSKLIDCLPAMKGSIAIVRSERREMRDVVAKELQSSVTPAIRGTLLPFSNASRRALFQRQHPSTASSR